MAAAPDPRTFPRLTISFLRGDTPDPYCVEYPDMLHAKFTAPHPRLRGYGSYEPGASILALPDAWERYWEEAGYYTRRKVRKATKEGYSFSVIERDDHVDDIFAINTSAEVRQGRPMAAAYRQRPKAFGPLPEYGCPRHQLRTYGVLRDGHLWAYAWVYQVGEMCLFSTILGHWDHLKAGIMYLLVAEAMRDVTTVAGTRYAMYNMHWSGTEGLRFFKEQMGFGPYRVTWLRGDETPEELARLERGERPQGVPGAGRALVAGLGDGLVRRARSALRRLVPAGPR